MKIKRSFTYIAAVFLVFILNGCVRLEHKNLDGSSNFKALISSAISPIDNKLKEMVNHENTILVSDFVNLENLKNNSKLGFLLSDMLKSEIINGYGVKVKEVELARDFTIGSHGFNLLSRDNKKILNSHTGVSLAMVGTYSITSQQLIIFIKLIDVGSGDILLSSTSSIVLNREITDLEYKQRYPKDIHSPMVL